MLLNATRSHVTVSPRLASSAAKSSNQPVYRVVSDTLSVFCHTSKMSSRPDLRVSSNTPIFKSISNKPRSTTKSVSSASTAPSPTMPPTPTPTTPSASSTGATGTQRTGPMASSSHARSTKQPRCCATSAAARLAVYHRSP